jgi:hypothetical protein
VCTAYKAVFSICFIGTTAAQAATDNDIAPGVVNVGFNPTIWE